MDEVPGVVYEDDNSDHGYISDNDALSDAETVIHDSSKRRKKANFPTTSTTQASTPPADWAVAETGGCVSTSCAADDRTDTVASNPPDSATIPVIIAPPTEENLATHLRHGYVASFHPRGDLATESEMSSCASTSDLTSSGSLFQEKPKKPEARVRDDAPSPDRNGPASQTLTTQPTDAKAQLPMKRPRQKKNVTLTQQPTAAVKIKTRQRRQKVPPPDTTATNGATQTTTTASSTNQDAGASTGTTTHDPLSRLGKPRITRRQGVKKENENPENRNCDVSGCSNIAERMTEKMDAVGPPGWRCASHIPGPACSSEGCKLYGRMRKRDGAVYCRSHIQQCVVATCVRTGRLRCPADLYGEAGWRCKQHGGGHQCNVQGCSDSGQVKAVADRLGPAGYRCDVHGRICSVPGCKSMGLAMRPADDIGPEGRRCTSHGGARKCNVVDCTSNAKLNIKDADSHGAAGPRCDRHSRICTADGCHKVGQRRCDEDFRGPAGYRCLRHGGGHECNVDNCNCIGQVKKKEADQFGPAGYRCNQHGQFCVISNCGRGGRCKRPADALGPAGYRCRAHVCP